MKYGATLLEFRSRSRTFAQYSGLYSGRFGLNLAVNVLSFDWFTGPVQIFIPGWHPRDRFSTVRLPSSGSAGPPAPPPPPQNPLRSGFPSGVRGAAVWVWGAWASARGATTSPAVTAKAAITPKRMDRHIIF